jgi:hypothetical protein
VLARNVPSWYCTTPERKQRHAIAQLGHVDAGAGDLGGRVPRVKRPRFLSWEVLQDGCYGAAG